MPLGTPTPLDEAAEARCPPRWTRREEGVGKGPRDLGPHTPWPSVSGSRCGWDSGRAPEGGTPVAHSAALLPRSCPPGQRAIGGQAALEPPDVCYSLESSCCGQRATPAAGLGGHSRCPAGDSLRQVVNLSPLSARPRWCSECPNKHICIPRSPGCRLYPRQVTLSVGGLRRAWSGVGR